MSQTPKYTLEIRELNVDISKDGGSESDLFVRVQILPIVVHILDPRASCDQLSNFSGGGCSASNQASVAAMEKSSATFMCEKFSVSCEFGHDRYYSFSYTFFFLNINLAFVGVAVEKRKWTCVQDVNKLT